MTNTRPRSRNKPSRRERRQATSTAAPTPRPAARPRATAQVYDTPTAPVAKVYNSAAPAAKATGAAPAAKVYNNAAPAVGARRTAAPPQRRSFLGEPAPVDYSGEYRLIRKDLRRILFWASILIVGMIVLSLFAGQLGL